MCNKNCFKSLSLITSINKEKRTLLSLKIKYGIIVLMYHFYNVLKSCNN